MKRTFFIALALIASCALLVPNAQAQVNGPTTATLSTTGSKVAAYCPGFNSADIYVEAGTLSGTVTVYTAANIGTAVAPSPGPTNAPPATVGNTQTLSSFPGHIYVSLASSPYVYGVLTTATSGSAPAHISCTNASAPAGVTAAISSLPPFVPATTVPVYEANVGTYPQNSSSPQPVQTTVPTNAYLYGASGAKWAAVNEISTNSDSVAASQALVGAFSRYGYNGTTWDRLRDAPSPAPTGVPAMGFNSGGAAAPVICDSGKSGTISSATPANLVTASAGLRIYLCAIDATLSQTTAAGNYTASLEYSANSACTSANTVIKTWRLVDGSLTAGDETEFISIGSGVGIIAPIVPANDYLCIVTSNADLTFDVNITYTQAP